MKWKKVRLGDIIVTKKGFAFKSHKYTDFGVPIVRVSDYTFDSISDKDLKYYPMEEKANYLEYELHEKDIIIQTVGSWQNNPASVVGKVVRVPELLNGALLNQNAVKILPINGVDCNYLFYRLKSDDFKGHLLGEARGAANQASITLETIKIFEFNLPTYDIQYRIGSILSAYDELIENNQKQIKLLEEVVHRLYKEWFVNLRFPGYDQTKIIDGVPEDWKKGYLGDIAEFKRGKTITKKMVVDGDVPVVAGGIEPAYYHNIANTKAPVITVSASGANAGFVRMYYIDIFASDCSFVDINTTEYLYFVYCFMINNKAQLDILQKGSAQPHVYAKDINAITLNIPNKHIMHLFCEITQPLFEKISVLEKINRNLKQTRDRLLPKLMSGEIEV